MIDATTIKRVYSGKLRGCMCGCRGNYSTRKATITRVVKELNALAAIDPKKVTKEAMFIGEGDVYYGDSETRSHAAFTEV
jgi:hypothetical protein